MEITKEEWRTFRNYCLYDIYTAARLSGLNEDRVRYMFYHYDELEDKYGKII